MISILPRLSESEALECITKCTATYHMTHSSKAERTNVGEIISACSVLPLPTELIKKIISAAMNLGIPKCVQHGDLSRSNLIYGLCEGKEDFWWIDWEYSADRVFFYDYFFYILNTAMYYSNTTALDEYLNGKYDDSLKAFFDCFCLEFDAQLRKDYYMIFALDFLRERVCDRGNSIALSMYRDFIIRSIFDKE